MVSPEILFLYPSLEMHNLKLFGITLLYANSIAPQAFCTKAMAGAYTRKGKEHTKLSYYTVVSSKIKSVWDIFTHTHV